LEQKHAYTCIGFASLVDEVVTVRLRILLAHFAVAGAFITLAACGAGPKPELVASVAPMSQKAPKSKASAFAGTTGVPQRRAVRGAEMTTEIAKRAREILDANGDVPYGTEVPFEIDGQTYVGRIEEHYHEPGGPRKPWGRHRGVTVYHAD
jgi:hypothetical protein